MRDWYECVRRCAGSSLRMVVACLALVVCVPATAMAQAARDYLNTPVDQFALTLDLIKTEGETAPASGLSLPNNTTVSGLVYPFFLYSFPLGGRYGGVSVTPSYSGVALTGTNGRVEGGWELWR